MSRIRVLLADDHAVLRAGLKALLGMQPDIIVVGEAGDGSEALRLAESLRPDVVLLDISMPGLDGLAALRQMRQCAPLTRVLILTMHADEGFLRAALAEGAAGYVLKRTAEGDLLAAIRAVARGEAFLDPALTRALIAGYLDRSEAAGEPRKAEAAGPGYDGLTAREVEVLKSIAQGYSNAEIAERLVISVKTVETHKAHIMEKLGRRSRVELVRYAMEKGLLDE
jgi:two-component system response regulator NreC